jgi:hypothetical protein
MWSKTLPRTLDNKKLQFPASGKLQCARNTQGAENKQQLKHGSRFAGVPTAPHHSMGNFHKQLASKTHSSKQLCIIADMTLLSLSVLLLLLLLSTIATYMRSG